MVANNPHMPPPNNPHRPKDTENMKADAGTNYDQELGSEPAISDNAAAAGLAKELAALAARAALIEKRRQMVVDVDSLFRTISENLVMIIVGDNAAEYQREAATNMVLGMMFDCCEKASQLVLLGYCSGWSYVAITARLQECTSDIVRRYQTGISAGGYYENVIRAIGKLHDILSEVVNNKA